MDEAASSDSDSDTRELILKHLLQGDVGIGDDDDDEDDDDGDDDDDDADVAV